MAVQFKQRRDDDSLIELTPLIDVIFLLLVFFMLSSTFMDSSLEITLPELSSDQTPDQPFVVVSADADGKLTLNGEPVTPPALESALASALQETGESRVFLRGDENLRYQQVVGIIESAGRAGAANVNFIYEEPAP